LHVWSSQLTGLVEEVDWVPEMLAPKMEKDATPTWKIGAKTHPSESCDEVCSGANLVCDQTSLDDLNGKDANYFKAKYALAGHTCNAMHSGCAGGSNCVSWGSPYIHNSGFAHGNCWHGSTPTVAPCNKKPVDGNHRRLCPCSRESDKSRQTRLSWFLTLQNSLAAIKHGIFGTECIQHAKAAATSWGNECQDHVKSGTPSLLGPTFAFLHLAVLLEIAAAEPMYKDSILQRMIKQQTRYAYLIKGSATMFYDHRVDCVIGNSHSNVGTIVRGICYTNFREQKVCGTFSHFRDDFTGYTASGNCCRYLPADARNIMNLYLDRLVVQMGNSFIKEACEFDHYVCSSPGFNCQADACKTYVIGENAHGQYIEDKVRESFDLIYSAQAHALAVAQCIMMACDPIVVTEIHGGVPFPIFSCQSKDQAAALQVCEEEMR